MISMSFDRLKELIEEYFGCKVVCNNGVWKINYGYGDERFQCELDCGSTLYFRHIKNEFLLVGFDSNEGTYSQEDIDEILAFNEQIQ